jgi:hypothetical protein
MRCLGEADPTSVDWPRDAQTSLRIQRLQARSRLRTLRRTAASSPFGARWSQSLTGGA